MLQSKAPGTIPAAERPYKRPWLPLLRTTPVVDIGLLFVLLPLWWVLGIDQIIWPVGLTAIALKVFLTRRRELRYPPPLRWLGLFLVAHLISGLFIVESQRYLTFARSLSAYISVTLLVFILINSIGEWSDIDLLLKAMIIMMGIAAVAGYLGIAELWRPRIETVLGKLLDDSIRNSMYGGRIAFKGLGHRNSFLGIEYFRIKSLFMFGTLYASANAIAIPITLFYLGQQSSGRRRLLLALVLGLIILNLLATTGRSAILACAGGAFIAARPWRYLRATPGWLKLSAVLLLLAGLGYLLTPGGSQQARRVTDQTIYARPGSAATRYRIYTRTLIGFQERPIFGWGSERDSHGPGQLPAGSHSYYLGMLYKHGLVGFLLFLAIWWSVWRQTRPPRQADQESTVQTRARTFLIFGRWILIAMLINSLTDVLDLDMLTFVLMWTVFSAMIAARSLYDGSAKQPGPGQQALQPAGG